MTAITGNYSKTIKGGFDERKRFIAGFVRKSIPWVDADENMKEWIRFTHMRRAFDTLIGNASPNNGFKPVGTGISNDFTLKGGDGTLNGAGRMYVAGMPTMLIFDTAYRNAGASDEQKSIHPKIMQITGTDTINDSSANYVVGELVGRTITPDITQPGITATILANTANTIQTDIDLDAAGVLAGARYRFELAPPLSGTRSDDIYINAWVDEIDGDDDPSIKHVLGTAITAQYFGQTQQIIFIKQGGGSVPLTYTDLDGLEHFLTKIGRIDRTTSPTLAAPDVVDLRETSGSLTAFVPKVGGTMTGNLQLNGANIVMLGAETVDGRDLSVDGAKLDTIDWTPSGVAAKLKLISWPVQGTNLAGLTGGSKNVSQYMIGRVPGGTDALKGVFTSPPLNRVILQNALTGDQFIDGTENEVFGRTTQAQVTLTGTLAFVFGSTGVIGSGTSLGAQAVAGDIVQGADGSYYTVSVVGPGESLTLLSPYLGVSAPTSAGRLRQRWTLTFFSNVAGTETAYSFGSSTGLSWFWHEMFDEATRPTINPLYGIPSDQVVGEIPDASPTQKGKVQLALADGTDATPLRVVQASDVRLGTIKAQKNSAVPSITGPEPLVNFIEGSGITIALTESGGKLHITITNTAPGGGGIGLGTGTPSTVNPSASAGASGTAAPFDHIHALDPVYKMRMNMKNSTGGNLVSDTALGFNPRFVVAVGVSSGGPAMVGFATALGQASVSMVGGGTSYSGAALLHTSSPADTWSITQFTSAGIVATHTGSSTVSFGLLTVGDILS